VQLKNKILGKHMTESSKTEENDDIVDNYDGFYFIPTETEDESSYKLAFFTFKDEMANAKPIESSEMGDKFHIAFFKADENDLPVFDDSFEAILTDPIVYINNLIGSGVSGCILRKTEKSEVWFQEYLDYITGGVFESKVREIANSIAER
jgi:hypothetical protein